MNKKELTEAAVRTKFITPAILGPEGAKWDVMTQLLEEHYFTKGRVIVQGKTTTRGEANKADYILLYKPGIPIAVVEAKDNNHHVGDGMPQALRYAEILDVPFAYSSNGDAFLEHDRTRTDGPVEREIPLDRFPTPAELWARFRAAKGYTAEQESIATQDYYDYGTGKPPRYYQLVAINRAVDAIARGQNRILLVMATGTGKTYTAFQMIWHLWKSGAKKRILFLVDRNILADQTKTNDFKPFGQAMTKITNRTADKSYEIYLSLYQAVSGTEEEQNIYKQFSPDFFDLVIVDECHRGSAADDANWRRILEYFSSATQIGLTATPKETKTVSNIEYFGELIYTYSLKQGIADGFLAPYKVVRVGLDKDLDGWRPEKGKTDKYGFEIEDREYNQIDFDTSLALEKRTAVVAAKVTEFLKVTDRFSKTIIFCENIDHAERMRQSLVNANPDLAAANAKYVMRITGDNDEGKAQLDNFIDPEATYPVTATTSRLMTMDVDAQTCRLIVLDRRIQSMTEFKQNIGRGTRINEDYGTRKTVRGACASLDSFLTTWADAERKQVIIEELGAKGVFLDELAEQVGRDYDAFDLICHVAFDQPPLTRRERADRVKKRDVFARHGGKARAVLETLLEKYADSGLKSLESMDVLKVAPLTGFGTPLEILSLFGGKSAYVAVIRDLESELYNSAA